MQFAIIETGGKQYRIESGKSISIEKLTTEAGGKVYFDKVLLVADGKEVKVGTPYISGVRIEASVVTHGRYRKIRMLRYHSKTRQRRRKGHRQHFTKVLVS